MKTLVPRGARAHAYQHQPIDAAQRSKAAAVDVSCHVDIATVPAIALPGAAGLLGTGTVQAIRLHLALATGRRAPVTAGVGA